MTPDDRAGDEPAPFHDAFADLAERARARNVGRAERVLELLGGGAADADDQAEAAQLLHAVTGSAGTFGQEELSDAARHLAALLRDGDGVASGALDGLRRAARGETSA